MSRDNKGTIGWSFLALIFGIIVLPFMIGREIYQSIKYPYNGFETDDAIRYGIFICIFSVFHYCICELSNCPVWTYF